MHVAALVDLRAVDPPVTRTADISDVIAQSTPQESVQQYYIGEADEVEDAAVEASNEDDETWCFAHDAESAPKSLAYETENRGKPWQWCPSVGAWLLRSCNNDTAEIAPEKAAAGEDLQPFFHRGELRRGAAEG